MRYRVARLQQGANLFGALLVLALAAAGTYYLYRSFSVEDQKPGCASVLEGCVQRCRATTTDNDATEACQTKCEEANKSCLAEQPGGK